MNEFEKYEQLIAHEERRGNTYKLLAESYQIPDEELLQLIESIEDDPDTPIAFEDVSDTIEHDLETYKVDHSKLFVGPFELLAPPYGSRYLEGSEQVMTESTKDVRDWYRSDGISIDIPEPDDHVAAELEYLYVLIVRELNAIAENDPETAIGYLERQSNFLDTHLGQWIEPFTEKVVTNAETELYRALGRKTSSFITDDKKRLHQILDGEDREELETMITRSKGGVE